MNEITSIVEMIKHKATTHILSEVNWYEISQRYKDDIQELTDKVKEEQESLREDIEYQTRELEDVLEQLLNLFAHQNRWNTIQRQVKNDLENSTQRVYNLDQKD